jgi:hypothetical protein
VKREDVKREDVKREDVKREDVTSDCEPTTDKVPDSSVVVKHAGAA